MYNAAIFKPYVLSPKNNLPNLHNSFAQAWTVILIMLDWMLDMQCPNEGSKPILDLWKKDIAYSVKTIIHNKIQASNFIV